MDLGEITKVANRKRLNADAEKLREKVSRETAKIIKLKVAQDTAYWDLKEKLQQVEGNHERLQQNMVEVQMQHETISGQYQDELRLRPDTLNKISTTREICDVLEEYSERLKATLSRCKGDQASLYEAYRKSGHLVRDLKTKHERADEKNRQLIENLQEKVKLTSEHQNQLVQYLTAAKQQSDVELNETRVKLATASTREEELTAAVHELRRQLEQTNVELHKRETTIVNIQKEAEQLVRQFTAQINIMKNDIADKENKIKETNEENESLKRALTNQEAFTASVREQSSQLMEQVAARDEQLRAATNERQQLLDNLKNAETELEKIKNFVLNLQDVNERLEKTIEEKNTVLSNAEVEILNLKEMLSKLEGEKVEICSLLGECQARLEDGDAKFAELQHQHRELEKTHEDMLTEANACREKQEAAINELSELIATKDKELDSKAGTIGQLMSEVRNATDATTKVEGALVKLRKETDAERDAASVRDDQHAQHAERLQAAIADKENELTKQMSVILDMRNEKERLLEKLEGMQNKIDNIQKELTGPQRQHLAQHGDAPELDDNAVPFALTAPLPSSISAVKIMDKPSVPPKKFHNEPQQLDNMLFSIFSDSSMEGDNVLDRREVNRRFEALSRGEGIAPVALSALKRRTKQTQPTADDDDELLSLSQLKTGMKNKEPRTFFKTKRADTKIKRMKGLNN